MTKHLLIFGGSGFIGQAICREAIKQGIPVISISPSGQPRNKQLRQQPLITWVQADVFTDNVQEYFANALAVVNLIGILRENPKKNLFYIDMIFIANKLIAEQCAKFPELPFLFLSANAQGPFIPKRYLDNKRRAEAYLSKLANPVIIFRPGLVVGARRPFSLVEGFAIFILAHIPFINQLFKPVYPINIQRLAKRIIQESQSPRTICLTPDDLKKAFNTTG